MASSTSFQSQVPKLTKDNYSIWSIQMEALLGFLNGVKRPDKPWQFDTRLPPITRLLFPKEDDNLLEYLNEHGVSIEPTWYITVIPTVLVNGGKGRSSYVPNYNPRDIIKNVRRLLDGQTMEPMDPWYRGFKGKIEKTATEESGATTYTVSGIVEQVDETTLRITELPVGTWTEDYLGFLRSWSFIKGFLNCSCPTTVNIEVTLLEENMAIAKKKGLLKKFRLISSISTSNMNLFDAKGTVKKYETPEQILDEFYLVRLEFYENRKTFLLGYLKQELLKLDDGVRFVQGFLDGEISLINLGRKKLQRKFEATDYLLSLHTRDLTHENVRELSAERDKLLAEAEVLNSSTPKDLWRKDLAALESELDVLY